MVYKIVEKKERSQKQNEESSAIVIKGKDPEGGASRVRSDGSEHPLLGRNGSWSNAQLHGKMVMCKRNKQYSHKMITLGAERLGRAQNGKASLFTRKEIRELTCPNEEISKRREGNKQRDQNRLLEGRPGPIRGPTRSTPRPMSEFATKKQPEHYLRQAR